MKHEVRETLPDGRVITTNAKMGLRAVRLHHPELRNCMYVIPIYSKRFPTPHPCRICRVRHRYQQYHLYLDNDGNRVVSERVYQYMLDEGLLGVLDATRGVVPRPMVLGVGPGYEQVVPAHVVDQEKGMIKVDGLMVRRSHG